MIFCIRDAPGMMCSNFQPASIAIPGFTRVMKGVVVDQSGPGLQGHNMYIDLYVCNVMCCNVR